MDNSFIDSEFSKIVGNYMMLNTRLSCWQFREKYGKYTLSVMAGADHYCSPRKFRYIKNDYDSFEVAVIDNSDVLSSYATSQFLGDKSEENGVAGWVSKEDILNLIETLRKYERNERENTDYELEMCMESLREDGFKPEMMGYKIFLSVWNEDATEAYHIPIHKEEVKHRAYNYEQSQK